ncbi:MAG: Rpn family recombination-promoting nuclease/putative transposase, partial [Thermoguttaceae bacterium]|nr:Rpn family recombination-promoting nuclease/putative transposase [Thermoguttaceae bacterium]
SFPPAFSSILKQKSFYSEKTILFTFIMSYFSQKISEKNRFRKWKLDIKAWGIDGRYFNIEIQTANQKGFNNRILYYWSGMYHDQLEQGQEYEALFPVISIVVARFNLFPTIPRMHNIFTLTAEGQPDCVFSDLIQIHTIELTTEKISRLPELHDELKNWLDFLSNGHKKSQEEMTMLTKNNSGIAIAAERYQRLCQNNELREMAIAHEKAERDRKGQLSFAREQGLEQGREEGLEQGLEQGREEGEFLSLRKTISNILTHRFPEADTSQISSLLQQIQNKQTLDSLVLKAMESASVEDFLSVLQDI